MPKVRRKNSRKLKNYIWFHTHGRVPLAPCFWCGVQLDFNRMTVDHEPPLSEGGSWTKAVLACRSCNLGRNDKRLRELGLR